MSIDAYPPNALSSADALLAIGHTGALPATINSTTPVAMGPTVQAYVKGGRPIRVSTKFRIVPGATSDVYRAIILQDGVPITDFSAAFPVWGWGQSFPPFSAVLFPAEGLHTYTMQISRETGGGTGSIQGVEYLMVEDIGGSSGNSGPIRLDLKKLTGTFSGFTSTPTDISPLLACTVNVPAGRTLRITGRVGMHRTNADGMSLLLIKEVETILDHGVLRPAATGSQNIGTIEAIAIVEPTPGVHTYRLQVQNLTGTGTTSVEGNGNYPMFLLVEDITGNDVPTGFAYEQVWTPLTLQGLWVNYGGWANAAFRKVNDMVYLRGLIRSGAVGTIGYLPAGYRPPAAVLFPVHTGEPHTLGRVDIQPTGEIAHSSGQNGYVSLSGIVFGVT